uniref:Uncharacterized protein LOC108170665 n=1 Tax=Rhizophora mucronata TaxID=61149 RepID=A0A2P2JFD8_RHIMU
MLKFHLHMCIMKCMVLVLVRYLETPILCYTYESDGGSCFDILA